MKPMLLLAATLGLILLAVPAGAQSIDLNKIFGTAKKTTDLGEKDLDEELELGEQMAATLLGASALGTREAEQRYVARVGHWVAAHSSRPELPWRFAVLDDETVNAFAAPGGHVFITRGLLLQLSSEAELAGVLAHEIAHVTRKHHLAAIRKAAGMEVAGGVLSIAAGLRGRTSRREQAIGERVLGATRELYAKGLDRDDEHEADRWALTYMARAGYDPFAYAAVLQWLESVAAEDSQVALLFTTHPAPARRLEQIAFLLTEQYAELGGLDLGDRFNAALADPEAVAASEPAITDDIGGIAEDSPR